MSNSRDYFFTLADKANGLLKSGEVLLLNYSGEQSDFIRINRAKVRQAGHVTQHGVELTLIADQKQVSADITLNLNPSLDLKHVGFWLDSLREMLSELPPDPYLLYSTEVRSGENARKNELPPASSLTESVLQTVRGLDFVGLISAGNIYAGFANSLGQKNWFETASYQIDASLFGPGDKAVKCSQAGFEWNGQKFADQVLQAKQELAIMAKPAKSLNPGTYRAYLAPEALEDFMTLLSYESFGLKDNRTDNSPLQALARGEVSLNPAIQIREYTEGGMAPLFQDEGFVKPGSVLLLDKGKQKDLLISPRSAKEYDLPTNGANGAEMPESLDMAGGDIPSSEILKRLGTGLYIGNVWYLNYSDRNACRMTGMTRFATFWVENGVLVAPVNTMRFDESIYRLLGSKLEGLTTEKHFLPDSSTYDSRSTGSVHLPGALVSEIQLTL